MDFEDDYSLWLGPILSSDPATGHSLTSLFDSDSVLAGDDVMADSSSVLESDSSDSGIQVALRCFVEGLGLGLS